MKTSKYQLDFLTALRQFEQEQITICGLAFTVSEKLDELARWARIIGANDDAQDIEKLWEQFNFIGGDSTATEEEFDQALEQLYDWADSPCEFDCDGNPISTVLLCRVRSS